MCSAMQFQGSYHDMRSEFPPALAQETDPRSTILYYKEKTVQCLMFANYTHGGDFVLETLIHYVSVEHVSHQDADTAVWLA